MLNRTTTALLSIVLLVVASACTSTPPLMPQFDLETPQGRLAQQAANKGLEGHLRLMDKYELSPEEMKAAVESRAISVVTDAIEGQNLREQVTTEAMTMELTTSDDPMKMIQMLQELLNPSPDDAKATSALHKLASQAK